MSHKHVGYYVPRIWRAGEPNNHDERCGEMDPLGFNDADCSIRHRYICAAPKNTGMLTYFGSVGCGGGGRGGSRALATDGIDVY